MCLVCLQRERAFPCVCVRACELHTLAPLSWVPKDGTTQKQKLINQPVPELAPLFLVSSFSLSSLDPCVSLSLLLLTPLRGGWGSSDALTPGFPLSLACVLFHLPRIFHSPFNLPGRCDTFFSSEMFSRKLHIFVVLAEAVKAIKAVCALTKDRYRCSQFRCDVTETDNTSVCPLLCRSVNMTYWTETILTYLNQRHPKVKLSFLCHLDHHVTLNRADASRGA